MFVNILWSARSAPSRNLTLDAVEERPVRTGHIRRIPVQISLIIIRLFQVSHKLCELRVKYIAASLYCDEIVLA